LNRDLYKVLGVDRNASQEDIKKAYKKLARQYHPDIAKDKQEAERLFREINEAYSVLSDDEKRARYDRFGPEGVKMSAPDFGGFDSPFGGFGGIGDIFEMFFDMGGGRVHTQSSPRPSRGRDLRYDLEITLEEAFHGVEKELPITRLIICPICHGSRAKPGTSPQQCDACKGTGQVTYVSSTAFGRMVRTSTCVKCRGEGQMIPVPCDECRADGRVERTQKLSVRIPPGVDSGSKIRLTGEGEEGERGGPSGDLYLFVTVAPHPLFRRNGNDLLLDKRITFPDAALGAEIEIKTIDGTEKLRIPPGTQSETVFRLKGRGMPSLRGKGHGDLLVKTIVVVPSKLNQRQKELLREFAKAGGHDLENDKGLFDKFKDAIFGKEHQP
jgi:molecular chaperone DnaJ